MLRKLEMQENELTEIREGDFEGKLTIVLSTHTIVARSSITLLEPSGDLECVQFTTTLKRK